MMMSFVITELLLPRQASENTRCEENQEPTYLLSHTAASASPPPQREARPDEDETSLGRRFLAVLLRALSAWSV